MNLAAAYSFGNNTELAGIDVSDLASLCVAEFDFEEDPSTYSSVYVSSINDSHKLEQRKKSKGYGVNGGKGAYSDGVSFLTSLRPNSSFKASRAMYFTKQQGSDVVDVPFIFSMWYRPIEIPTGTAFLVDNINGSGTDDSHYRFLIANNSMRFILRTEEGGDFGSFAMIAANTPSEINKWYHLCIIYNGDKNDPEGIFFIDGSSEGSSYHANPYYQGMQALNPGNFIVMNEWQNNDTVNQASGVIDKLQLFKEIDYSKAKAYAAYLYNNGLGRLFPFN